MIKNYKVQTDLTMLTASATKGEINYFVSFVLKTQNKIFLRHLVFPTSDVIDPIFGIFFLY